MMGEHLHNDATNATARGGSEINGLFNTTSVRVSRSQCVRPTAAPSRRAQSAGRSTETDLLWMDRLLLFQRDFFSFG